MSASVTATRRSRISVSRSLQSQTATARAPKLAIYLHDLSGGGVERQSLVIAEELRARGAEVTLVLHSLRGPLLDQVPPGLRVVDLKARRTLEDVSRLADFLRQEKPDILVANFDLNNIAALLAKAVSMSRTKVIICQHNTMSRSFFASERWLFRYVGLAYRALAPFVSQAVGVSAGLSDELRRLGGIPAERIVTINNPVIGPDFQARIHAPVSHPWLHDPDHRLFVTAGRLVPQKDHATMLRALALHRRSAPSRLLILGAGPLEAELKALATSLGIDDAVAFLGFRSDALAWFRHADAFLLTSVSEGFGNVLVEALGCGTPVISTDCAYGPGDILEKGRYGLLVPQRDPAALAQAMDQVDTLRARFPAETLKERANAFTYDVCAARYISVFEALAPKHAWALPA